MLERESKNGILFQTESKKISFRNQTNGVLGQNQTYRSTEQNREPRNKPRNLHSISLQKRRLKATMEKRQSFQQVVLGKRDSLTLTNKVRTVHHTKNKPKMTQRLNFQKRTLPEKKKQKHSNIFLDQACKTKEIKANLNKQGLIKFISFSTAKRP